MTPQHTLIPESIPIGSVQEHPENARRGDTTLIKESLLANGQYVPIVVQRSTGFILKGNHTHRSASELGWESISAVMLDVDDDRARRIMLADNKTSDGGAYDDQSLAALLESLDGELTGTGYDARELDDLLAILHVPTLDELEKEHGTFDQDALVLRLQLFVPVHVRDRWNAHRAEFDADGAALGALLDGASRAADH